MTPHLSPRERRAEAPANACADSRIVEGIARVVRVAGDTVWLEPEQTASCGSCAGAAACHGAAAAPQAPGIGTVTSRLQARRFPLDAPDGATPLAVGDRVVLGVPDGALVRGALLAYALPLLVALSAGALAEAAYGSDPVTLLAMAGGLGGGLLAARRGARRLFARGDLAPRLLRRAPGGPAALASSAHLPARGRETPGAPHGTY